MALAMALATLPCLGAAPAAAHPHVWISVRTMLLYAPGGFTGLVQSWTFDQAYTSMAIEGLDKNKDGRYDREELAELAKVNIEGLKDFAYFTTARVQGQEIKFREPSDYWLEHKDGALSLHFNLPFTEPVAVEAKGLAYTVQDPTFFIAFDLAKTDPARLAPGAPAACKLIVGGAKGDDNAAALSDAFAKQFGSVAVGGSRSVSVDCQAP
jgi:ABC-type uncharacterized transport system substrate-binding protein